MEITEEKSAFGSRVVCQPRCGDRGCGPVGVGNTSQERCLGWSGKFVDSVPGVFTPVTGKHQIAESPWVIQRVTELPTNQGLTSAWAD
jgi:hypothetical protein